MGFFKKKIEGVFDIPFPEPKIQILKDEMPVLPKLQLYKNFLNEVSENTSEESEDERTNSN